MGIPGIYDNYSQQSESTVCPPLDSHGTSIEFHSSGYEMEYFPSDEITDIEFVVLQEEKLQEKWYNLFSTQLLIPPGFSSHWDKRLCRYRTIEEMNGPQLLLPGIL